MPDAAPRPCRVSTCPRFQPCPEHVRPAFAHVIPLRPRSARSWRARRKYILDAAPYCGACARLGRTTYAVEVDHIIPIAEGGTDDLLNLQGLCAAHHRAKSDRDRERAIRRRLGRMP